MTRAIVVLVLVATGTLAWRAAPWDSPVEPTVIFMDPEITWSPDAPSEGTLFRLTVTASEHTPLLAVRGEVGPEEVHFRPTGGRAFEGFAAIPVGSTASVTAHLRVTFEAGGEKAFDVEIPVTPGEYHHEALSVAPRFGAPLGEADQARLEHDQAMAAEAARIAHRTPPLWGETVVLPRDSRVTSGFGDGRIFNGQVSSRHMGLDLQGFRGDTVVAASRGVVVLVEPFLLAGNVVYVNHGAGILSAYFHLSEQLVSVGDTVDAGTPVGRVGATGRVTGPHLHWVVRLGRTSVDPRSLLAVLSDR